MAVSAQIDWRTLRGALAVFAGAFLLTGVLLASSHHFESRVQQERQAEKSRLAVVRNDYSIVEEERQLIGSYLSRYRKLEQAGIVGSERRLSWVEALSSASANIKLPSLSYQISSRQRYIPEFSLETGLFRVYASEMDLRVGLLHEEDLLTLFHALDTRASGLYSVARCDLARNGESFRLSLTAENLIARCLLRWFTIGLPEDA